MMFSAESNVQFPVLQHPTRARLKKTQGHERRLGEGPRMDLDWA